MIKFIKSIFTKKTPEIALVVEKPKVEEPKVLPEVSNPIIHTTVITTENSKKIVAEPAKPEKKKRKSNKPKQEK